MKTIFILTVSLFFMNNGQAQSSVRLGLCDDLKGGIYSAKVDTLYIENGQGYCESYNKVLDKRIAKMKNLTHLTYIGYPPYLEVKPGDISLPKEISKLSKLKYINTSFLNNELFNLKSVEQMSLNCSEDQYHYLNENSFDALSKLKKLDLAFAQRPDSVQFSGIKDLAGLESVTLRNPSQQLIDECLANKNLKDVHISFAKQLSFDFSATPQIEHLSIELNDLEEVPKSVYDLSELKSLIISSNKINTISKDIGRLTKIEHLDFSTNVITSIPETISNCKELRIFDFKGNKKLSALPKEIGNFVKLTQLKISDCHISEIPASFSKCVALTHLHAGHNQFTSLDVDFSNFKQLEEVNFALNKLDSIHPSLFTLNTIRRLLLQNNRLVSLAPTIGKMTSLEKFSINYNKLRSLPDDIGKLKKLEYLSAYHNEIETIPASLSDLENLRDLHFGNNEIKQFPKDLDRLTSLQTFELQSNPLKRFPKEIYDIKSLDRIWVSGKYRLLAGFKVKEENPMVILTN